MSMLDPRTSSRFPIIVWETAKKSPLVKKSVNKNWSDLKNSHLLHFIPFIIYLGNQVKVTYMFFFHTFFHKRLNEAQ